MNVLRTFNLRPDLWRTASLKLFELSSYDHARILWKYGGRVKTEIICGVFLIQKFDFLVIIWKTVLELYTSNHTGSSFHVVYLLMICPLHTVIILVNDTIAMAKVVFGFMVGLNHVFQSSNFHISKLSNSFVFAISWHKKKKIF